jgi:hypothetical protein
MLLTKEKAVTKSSTFSPVSGLLICYAEDSDLSSLELGIDTFRIRGLLACWPDVSAFDRQEIRRDGVPSSARTTLPSGAQLGVDARSRGIEAWIEASLPNVKYGSIRYGLTVCEARRVIESLYEEASRYVSWIDKPDQLRLMRMDVIQDFLNVVSIHEVIDGLRNVKIPYGSGAQLWADHSLQFTGFRRVRKGDREIQLYSKQAEVLSRAKYRRDSDLREALRYEAELAEGTMRCETVARPRTLNKHGLHVLGDLTPDLVEKIHRDTFVKAGFDQAVGGRDRVRAALQTCDPADRKTLERAIGTMFIESLGVTPSVSHNTWAKHRTAQKKYDLSVGDLIHPTRSTIRLDYATRTVVRSPGDPDRRE